MKKSNIILIGMPSAGKSSIGRPLAEALGMKFIDTDEKILQQEKRPLKDIVNIDGLAQFLKIQESIVILQQDDNCVISTGGSVIYSKRAMEHIKANGIVIYLQIGFEELEKRVVSGRRFARNEGQTFRELYEERVPLYEKYADFTVNCSGKTVDEIIKSIIQLVNGKV